MRMSNCSTPDLSYMYDPHIEKENQAKLYGFWLYLMSDCVLFATLFTTFIIFSSSDLAIKTAHNALDLHNTIWETVFLLTSTFTFGLSRVALDNKNRNSLVFYLGITFILGALFVAFELHEFYNMISNGYGPDQNVYLSAFFSLVATHGLHVACGLIWMALMIFKIFQRGLVPVVSVRLQLLGLFWHFLDIVWVGIFSFVYLIGTL